VTTLQIETPRALAPLLHPSRYKGAHGGRGGGKSHFFAESIVERALYQPGLRVVCIREVQKSLEQSVYRLIKDKIKKLGVGELFRVLNTHIETPGDGVIIFQGMQNHTADSIKSLEGFDIAWIEEAQSLSQRSLDLLRPTIRKEDSEMWFSWNPENATDPVDQLLRSEHAPTNSVVVQVNYQDNPWLPQVLTDELEYDQRRDPDKFAHVWLGGYQQHSEARVFRNWTVEEFEAPEGTAFYLGGDWGYSVDPTVGVRCYLDGNRLLIDYEVYQIGVEIDHLPAFFDRLACPGCWDQPVGVKCNHSQHRWARRWPFTVDNARPETISYCQRFGYPKMRAAKKGAGSIDDGIEFLRMYDIVVHPRCKHVIQELSLYRYKVDAKTGEVIPILADKDNHIIDSLRYAVENLRRKTAGAFHAHTGLPIS